MFSENWLLVTNSIFLKDLLPKLDLLFALFLWVIYGVLMPFFNFVYPEFPLDFFEKTSCITTDIKLGGDVIHNSDSVKS